MYTTWLACGIPEGKLHVDIKAIGRARQGISGYLIMHDLWA